jgi:UDP-N-acetylglucosamine pyrophosphorylase
MLLNTKNDISLEEKYQKIKNILKKYNQEHLILKYEKLNSQKKEQLLKQILEIDFEQIIKLYKKTQENNIIKEEIKPIPYIEKAKLKEQEKQEYVDIGKKILKENQYAVVTLAGGQGTRLGHSGPKGTYVLNIIPPKSLFQILCEKLKQTNKKYGCQICWYIMTSNENHLKTIEFFEKNKYFDYPKNKIKFFSQGEIPMIDINGKILLTQEGLIKKAADGHRWNIYCTF